MIKSIRSIVDIISFMKDGVNGDDLIAKKYGRSKGHVIKMKRQLGSVVKTRIKEEVF